MAHHSDQPLPEDFLPDGEDTEPSDKVEEAINSLRDEAQEQGDEASPDFGATGRQPEGKLTDEDEGEIRFGVAEKDGKVVLDFGKKVHWIAATPEQAKALAGSLLNKARKASS
jgi:hypothetical protein